MTFKFKSSEYINENQCNSVAVRCFWQADTLYHPLIFSGESIVFQFSHTSVNLCNIFRLLLRLGGHLFRYSELVWYRVIKLCI